MFTRLIRKALSEKGDSYIFQRYTKSGEFSLPREAGLYIHIPFCRNMCPYCPYNKIFYEQEIAARFKVALLREIRNYRRLVKDCRFTSLYIGGGTPTLMIDDLGEIVSTIKEVFDFKGSIAIETNPNDIDSIKAQKISSLGVELVSLGVQSFRKKFLRCIGRNYDQKTIIFAIEALQKYDFKTINLDLIFVFPGQTLADLREDLRLAVKTGVEQITCYPLFTFPYTRVGKYKKLKKIHLPNIFKRRSMYFLLHDYLQGYGYERSSVWSFSRPASSPYSSVTRDFYLGLGPGAGSYTKDFFYFNTFSVPEYISRLNKDDDLAISLEMKVSERMAKLFWFYWRLYETKVTFNEYSKLFKSDIHKDIKGLLKIIRFLGFSETSLNSHMRLNKKGTHWIHLMQNYFALNYVSKLWDVCTKEPWPEKVKL